MVSRRSMITRSFVLIFAFFLVFMSIASIFIYRASAQTVKKQLVNKCMGIAIATATLIERDTAGYREFIDTLDMDSDFYKTLKSDMESIRFGNEDNIAFLYTEIRVSETEMMYVLDGELENTDTYTPPGMMEPLTETRRIAYETQAPYAGDFVTTVWGTLMSAYAPIFDKDTDEFIGIVGVDVSIDQYNAVLQYQLYSIVGSIAVLILMIASLLFVSSGRMERMIAIDSLTGAYNKAFFMRILKAQIKEIKKTGIPVTVFMADLDHFKAVNDTYGHPFGDIVLESVTKTIALSLRKTDTFARYGGEEFVGILPGLPPEAASGVVERIRKAVENTAIFNSEQNKAIKTTVSIGIAFLEDGQTADDIINKVDKALYHAKITRNSVSVYRDGLFSLNDASGEI